VSREYVKHQSSKPRSNDGVLDIGAFEMEDGQPADLALTTSSLPDGTVGTSYHAVFCGHRRPAAVCLVAGWGHAPTRTFNRRDGGRHRRDADDGGDVEFQRSGKRLTEFAGYGDACVCGHNRRGAATQPRGDHNGQPAQRAPEQELQPYAHRRRRHNPVRVEHRGGQPAARPEADRVDGRDQREGDDAGNVRVHGAGDGQSVDGSDSDTSAVDYSDEIGTRTDEGRMPELKLGPTYAMNGGTRSYVGPSFSLGELYSYLSARTGLTRLARCAGISPAAAETSARSTTVVTAIHGSCAWMP
jgi:hypothetical protein